MKLSPKEARSEWVKALRSGKYRQGTHVLRSPVDETYCCLGVACDLYREHGLVDWHLESNSWRFLGEKHVLPERVRRWLGFKHSGVGLKNTIEVNGRDLDSLMDMNDAGRSFAEIADFIEEGDVILEGEES